MNHQNLERKWQTSTKEFEEKRDYFEYFGPDYRLHLPVSNMENLNSKDYLDRTKIQLLEILRDIPSQPGGQIQTGQVESQTNPRGLMEIVEDDHPANLEEESDKNSDKRTATDVTQDMES